MHYKTVALALLEARPDLYERLRISGKLFSTMESLAGDSNSAHLHFMGELRKRHPGVSTPQLESEAMELAVAEVEARITSMGSGDVFNLDAAMAFLREHSSAD